MITIYGVAPSRTYRCLWLLEELGIEYQREPVRFDEPGEARDRYLKVNPNGRVPCLVDEDLVLFESLAINLYLIKRYGGPLAASSIEDEGRALQWSFWGANEIEPLLDVFVRERVYKPESDWDKDALAEAESALEKPTRILDDHLADRDYLLGSEFSIADLNLAGVMFPGPGNGYDLAPFANVGDWFTRCTERAASQRVVEWAMTELPDA